MTVRVHLLTGGQFMPSWSYQIVLNLGLRESRIHFRAAMMNPEDSRLKKTRTVIFFPTHLRWADIL